MFWQVQLWSFTHFHYRKQYHAIGEYITHLMSPDTVILTTLSTWLFIQLGTRILPQV